MNNRIQKILFNFQKFLINNLFFRRFDQTDSRGRLESLELIKIAKTSCYPDLNKFCHQIGDTYDIIGFVTDIKKTGTSIF